MKSGRALILSILFGGIALGQQSLNLANLKSESRILEGIINEVVRQSFNHPYALETEPMASYLQGYGLIVSFQLYVNRPAVRSPFVDGKVTPGEKAGFGTEEQIHTVREKMIQCLADYGAAIKQLSAHDRVAVSAHIEDRSQIQPGKNKTVLVIAAKKDDIDLLAMRRISNEDFRERVTVVRY